MSSRFINVEEASRVFNHPEVFDRITSDECPETIEWPNNGVLYLGVYLDNNLAAVFVVHPTERGLQYHANILPEYRDYKYLLTEESFNVYDSLFDKLYCEVPSLFPSVLKFAMRIGFKPVEVKEQNYLKNGKYYDTYVMER